MPDAVRLKKEMMKKKKRDTNSYREVKKQRGLPTRDPGLM